MTEVNVIAKSAADAADGAALRLSHHAGRGHCQHCDASSIWLWPGRWRAIPEIGARVISCFMPPRAERFLHGY